MRKRALLPLPVLALVLWTRSSPKISSNSWASCRILWKAGEVRPTHRKPAQPARTWRTRQDPFAEVWPQVLSWLEAEPDVTAKALFIRLLELHPDDFNPGQLRTLQRRVREWRQRMARALIFCGAGLTDGSRRPGEITL